MEHEDTLNILFGEETGAKSDLEKLKEQIEYDRLPDSMKDTITNNKTEVAEISVAKTEEVEDDTISSHNSVRIEEESAITNNSVRIEEETHITNNADDIHEHVAVEGTISSHNFENQ